MQKPVQITFRHMSPSAAVETRVREHVERLERFHDHITSCQVVIDAPPGHRNKGAPFAVKIDLAVPGKDISIRSDAAAHDGHSDVYIALRDAFDSARRVLQDYARTQRLDVKHHETAPLG
jgi:ribosomal subunit interface protein